MSSGGGPRVRGTRAARHRSRIGSRVAEAALALVIVAGAVTYAVTRTEGSLDPQPSGRSSRSAGPSELAAIAVTGARVPLVLVVGAEPDGAVVLPPSLSFTAPGQGDVTAADVAAFPGDTMRVAVSNAVGAWAGHYGVLDLNGVGRLVDGAGGIGIELSEPVVAGPDVLGPGPVRLTGPGAITFLADAKADETLQRLVEVWDGLLRAPPQVRGEDFLATDDAQALGRLLRRARGARVSFPPTRAVTGTVRVPDQPAFDRHLSELFGTTAPIRAIVQNGSGEPAIGEAVARELIPAGFRIVLSGNADSFDHRRTDVLAEGSEHVAAARRARRALGVGRVALSQVPSGIADITIVVGKDFNG